MGVMVRYTQTFGYILNIALRSYRNKVNEINDNASRNVFFHLFHSSLPVI